MYQHILVSTDLSEMTTHTIGKASELAQKLGARLSMVHVIEPMYYHGYPYVAEFETALHDHARQEIEKLGEQCKVGQDDQHIVSGSVKAEIVHLAESIEADLIVVGSHSNGGLSRLLGSSASGIVNFAHQDVLVIRAE